MKKNTQKNSPIAIIGIGCRFPGGASSPTKFWNLLKEEVDAIVDVPEDRWDIRRFYDPNYEKPGKIYFKQGGFLQEKIDQFDPLFFGISPREAELLDPLQRILLESSFEAFEDAGIQVENLKGSRTGVFIGGFVIDNYLMQLGAENKYKINSHTAASISICMLSNKISYIFDLKGPSLSVDTACSSSLVSVDMACKSIWMNECNLAIAGGANVMFKPEFNIALSKGKFTAKDGRSRAFDEKASGYARGEGGGVVVLKPYDQAIKDNDDVYALINAISVNHDGQTNGISVPNPNAQRELIQAVLKQADIDVNQIHYVEAHGTGTAVGDPLEMETLNSVLSEGRSKSNKCWVGSVKTNIGHLEAGAGIAGLIKAALVLKNKEVPPNLHYKKANPKLNIDELQLKIATSNNPLPADEISYAAVNSFGYGGSNAHAILQESPTGILQTGNSKTVNTDQNGKKNSYLYPISARDNQALMDLSQRYLDYLDATNTDTRDLAYSMSQRRSHHRHRLAIFAESITELKSKLKAYTANNPHNDVIVGQEAVAEKPKLVFVYTGMGPQWWGMGQTLIKKDPIFRDLLEKYDEVFSRHSGWSILNEMIKDEESSRIKDTDIAQPANFVLQTALTARLKSFGIVPDIVVGHSVGEISACYASGALSLEDALLVSFHRSRLQKTTEGQGKMLAIGQSEKEILKLISFYDDISIAAVNSPSSVTLSGNETSLNQLAGLLDVKKIFNRFLDVKIPYHSWVMDSIKDELIESLRPLDPRHTEIPLYSTVTAKEIEGTNITADYWFDNVRETVQFSRTIQEIGKHDDYIYVEIGPHPVLRSSIGECLDFIGVKQQLVQTLNRKEDEFVQLYKAVARLYTLGVQIDWQQVNSKACSVKLPTYPWQKKHYWHESKRSKQDRLGLKGSVFLNQKVLSPLPIWEVELNRYFFPFLDDHVVQGAVVFPGAGYLAAGMSLAEKLENRQNGITLENVVFSKVLAINHSKVQKLFSSFHPETRTFSVHSEYEDDENRLQSLHASGRITENLINHPINKVQLKDLKNRCSKELDVSDLYQKLKASKLEYGPYFRIITGLWKGAGELVASIKGHEKLINSSDPYLIHPTILDASFQTLVEFGNKEMVPVHIGSMTIYRPVGFLCWCHTKITESGSHHIKGDITLFDDEGTIVGEVFDLTCREIVQSENYQNIYKNWLYDIKWFESPKTAPNTIKKHNWLILSDDSETAQSLCGLLENSDEGFVSFAAVFDHKGHSNSQMSQNDHILNSITKELENPDISSIDEIVYLCGKSNLGLSQAVLNEELPVEDCFSKVVDEGLRIIQLMQVISQLKLKHKVNFTLVTCNSQKVVPTDKGDEGLAFSPLWGMSSVFKNEFPDFSSKCIDLESINTSDSMNDLVNELLSKNTDEEVAFREHKRFVKHLERTKTNEDDTKEYTFAPPDCPIQLITASNKNSSVPNFEKSMSVDLNANEVKIKTDVCFLHESNRNIVSGKKLKDHRIESQKENPELELCGRIIEIGENIQEYQIGDEVFAYNSEGKIQSEYTVKDDCLIPALRGLKGIDGAMIFSFVTVFHCLGELAQLKCGDKVLIHSATEPDGLAAIQYANWKGAIVFATADTQEKQDYLKTIGVEHAFSSNNLEFVRKIRNESKNEGIDVVLNTLSGELLNQSLSLLAENGRFIDLASRQSSEEHYLPTSVLRKGISYFSVNRSQILKDCRSKISVFINEIEQGLDSGLFSSLPGESYSAQNIELVSEKFEKNENIGNLAIDFQNQDIQIKQDKIERMIRSDSTYLVTGGTRGFGLEISKWLIKKGARHVVLISKTGAVSPESQKAIEEMKANGSSVIAFEADIAVEEDLSVIINNIKNTMPTIAGIFHLAMVLDDAFIIDMEKNKFEKVLNPKIKGALNLHKLTRDIPLDYFVSMSSISSLIGNVGQVNYVVANSFLDAFSHYRTSKGLVGTSINLGALNEVGVAARSENVTQILNQTGIKGIKTEDALLALEYVLVQKPVQIGVFDIDWESYAQKNPQSKNSSFLNRLIETNRSDHEIPKVLKSILNQLAELEDKKQHELIASLLSEELGKILGLSPSKIDCNLGINFLGVDSILINEFVNAITTRIGVKTSLVNLLSGPSVNQLASLLLNDFICNQPLN